MKNEKVVVSCEDVERTDASTTQCLKDRHVIPSPTLRWIVIIIDETRMLFSSVTYVFPCFVRTNAEGMQDICPQVAALLMSDDAF